jgi:hypothetical protein
VPSRIEIFSYQPGAWWLGLNGARPDETKPVSSDNPLRVDAALLIKGSDATAQPTVNAKFSHDFEIPAELFEDPNATPLKLKSAAALATEELRRQRDELLRRLGMQEIIWKAADKRFLNLPNDLSFTADGSFAGDVKLQLVNIGTANPVIAEFAVRGAMQVTANDKANHPVQAFRSFALVLVIKQSALPKLRLDFDDFNLSLPEIDFPDLDLSVLKRLPLPLNGADMARMFKSICGGNLTVALTTTAAAPQLEINPANGKLALALRESAASNNLAVWRAEGGPA